MVTEMKPDEILCCIDVNDFDQEVIDVAATFARQAGKDLHLLHITLSPDPAGAAWPAYVGSPNFVVEDNLRLKKVDTNVAGVQVARHHLSGLPTEKILDFVERNMPRLLVLGTHGRRGLSRLLGSTAAAVLRKVPCPVLIVRQRQRSEVTSKVR